MNNPLISIIIPAYNCSKTLPRAVYSALAQTYKNLDIIIVNDGSTDDTSILCDSFKNEDGRVQIIHKTNGRQASARNAGLRVCKGEFVLCLDSDDELQKNACEKLLNCIDEHTDFVLYGFNIYYNGQLLRTPNPGNSIYENDDWGVFCKHIKFLMPSACNKFYRRKYITVEFDEKCVHGEDTQFNYANFDKGVRIRSIQDCLYNVHLDNLNSVNKSIKPGRLFDCLTNVVCMEDKIEAVFSLSLEDIKKNRQENITRIMYEINSLFFSFPLNVAKSEIESIFCIDKMRKILDRNTKPSTIYLRPLLFFVKHHQYRLASIYCNIVGFCKYILKKR